MLIQIDIFVDLFYLYTSPAQYKNKQYEFPSLYMTDKKPRKKQSAPLTVTREHSLQKYFAKFPLRAAAQAALI